MKTEDDGVADLTQEAGLEDASDSELFANLAPRAASASGLHRRPQKALAEVARLGALVPSVAPGRSVPPPPSAPGSNPVPPGPPTRSLPPRLSSAAPIPASITSRAFDDDDALTPARQTIPVPRSSASRNARIAIVVGAAALLVFVVVAAVVSAFKRSGALLVTVTGPGSSEVAGVEVLVDGEKRCAASPCRVASIEPGTHLVNVRARGFNPTAALATTVAAGTEGVMNVALTPTSTSAPAASLAAASEAPKPQPLSKPAAPAEPDRVQATGPKRVDTRPAAGAPIAPASTAPAGVLPSSAPAPAAAASATSGDKSAFGTLRIVSLPVASILVDGRPIGRTPQVVRVSPGQHRVAIVAGEDRRAQTVTVAPGATQVVSVRF